MTLLTKKTLALLSVFSLFIVNIFFFQNCSNTSFLKGQAASEGGLGNGTDTNVSIGKEGNVSPGLESATDASTEPSTNAIVTENNNIIASTTSDGAINNQVTETVEPQVDSPSECSQLANHYHSRIDISKVKGDTIHTLSGANFIYSSKAGDHYPSIIIDDVKGKTLICGLTIDKITVKKGRLDLINSTVNELIEQSGKIIADEASKILHKI